MIPKQDPCWEQYIAMMINTFTEDFHVFANRKSNRYPNRPIRSMIAIRLGVTLVDLYVRSDFLFAKALKSSAKALHVFHITKTFMTQLLKSVQTDYSTYFWILDNELPNVKHYHNSGSA